MDPEKGEEIGKKKKVAAVTELCWVPFGSVV